MLPCCPLPWHVEHAPLLSPLCADAGRALGFRLAKARSQESSFQARLAELRRTAESLQALGGPHLRQAQDTRRLLTQMRLHLEESDASLQNTVGLSCLAWGGCFPCPHSPFCLWRLGLSPPLSHLLFMLVPCRLRFLHHLFFLVAHGYPCPHTGRASPGASAVSRVYSLPPSC